MLYLGLMFIVGSPKAYAVSENTNNIPQFIQDAFYVNPNCNNNEPPFNPPSFNQAQFNWMSIAGDNSITSASIPYGTDTLNLWLNSLNASCNGAIDGNGNIWDTNLKITRYNNVSASSNAGQVNGLGAGTWIDVDMNESYANNQRWAKYQSYINGADSPFAQAFNVSGLSGLAPGNHVIQVNTTVRVVNQFGGPVYQCVGDPRQFTNDLAGFGDPNNPADDCATFTNSFTVNIYVIPPNPNGGLDSAGCDLGDFTYAHRNNNTYTERAALLGAAQSKGYDWTQVHVYIDDGNGSGPSQYVPLPGDSPPWGFDAWHYPLTIGSRVIGPGKPPYGTGVPDWHDWFVVPTSAMNPFVMDNKVHTLYVFAIGKNPDGSNNGNNNEIFQNQLDGTKNRLTIGPCRPPDGTIYTSKYNPPSHAANGVFTDVDDAVNDARVCLTNAGGVTFACNTDAGRTKAYRENGWNQGGIWALPFPDNDYRVTVDVPFGYYVTGSNRGSPTCTSGTPGQGTGRCTVNGVNVQPGSLNYVDFWFDKFPPPVCGAISLLDPNANNNPFASTPEVGRPITVDFGPPTSVRPGVTQYSISNIVVNPPTGLSGFTGNQGPTTINPPNNIRYNNVTGTVPNRYTFTYTVSMSAGGGGVVDTVNCTGEISIANKPYLRVYGNDVRVGGGFKAANGICTVSNPKATILAFNRGEAAASANSETWIGSASQFASFALGEIGGFMSAGQNNPRTNTPAGSSITRPVLDLTFGNYDPTNSIALRVPTANPATFDTGKVEGFGGESGMANCITDYYTAITTGGGTNIVGSSIGASTKSGSTAEYHDGDLQINGNIDYPASWADGSTPSYYLVVKGDIYIQANVSKLAGVYIAQPDPVTGEGGHIYTCANNLGLYTGTQLYEACNNARLVVNGAFIAKQVKFQRTIDSLRDASSNETAASSRAAEIFDFSPEVYITNPHGSLRNGSTKVQYDFITSLPPIL